MLKTIKLLLCVLVLTAMSCEKEDNSIDVNTVELELEATFKSLTNSKIGFEKDGQLVLAVSNDLIIMNIYVFIVKGGEVSTLALLKDRNNQYRSGSTVCTTHNCASGGGCLPSGNYCTKCTPPLGYPDDCVRTSTGNQ